MKTGDIKRTEGKAIGQVHRRDLDPPREQIKAKAKTASDEEMPDWGASGASPEPISVPVGEEELTPAESKHLALFRAAGKAAREPTEVKPLALLADAARALAQAGNDLVAAGDREAVLFAYRKSLAICEQLVAADPGNAGWQRDLADNHVRIGDVLLHAGDREGARDAYGKALAITEKLAAADPGNAGWQHDLFISHDRIGDVLFASDRAAALDAYRKSLAILEQLAAVNPGNANLQRDLTYSHTTIGDVLLAAGDREGGRDAYRKALAFTEQLVAHPNFSAITEKLVAADPGNVKWQRLRAFRQITMGDMLFRTDHGAARAAYRKGFTISEKLTAADPGNAEWQHDLAFSYENIGDVLVAAGDNEAARTAYRKAFAFFEQLAAAALGNAVWQRDRDDITDKISKIEAGGGAKRDEVAGISTWSYTGPMPDSATKSWPSAKKEIAKPNEAGKAIRQARLDAGLTQDELAKRVGTDQANIARLENGRSQATSTTLKRIAKATQQRIVVTYEPS